MWIPFIWIILLRFKFLHTMKYQKEVPTYKGIWEVGSDLPDWILGKEAAKQLIPKEEGG